MDFTPGSQNRLIINQEFNQEKYKEFRNWYFTSHTPEQLENYKTQFYQHLELHQKILPFVEWYQSVNQPQLNAIEDQYKTWTTTERQATHALHPPPQALELAPNGETARQPLLATAFIDAQSGKFTKTEGLMVKQNNYTNLICQTMSKQLTRIEEVNKHTLWMKKRSSLGSTTKLDYYKYSLFNVFLFHYFKEEFGYR